MSESATDAGEVGRGGKGPSFAIEWIVTLSSTVGLGVGAAFLVSIQSVNPSLEFVLDWKTWVSMAIVGWLSFWGCRLVLFPKLAAGSAGSSQAGKRWGFFMLVVLTFGGMAASVAYSLRGVSREKLVDVGIGFLLAAFFLSIVSFLFVRTVNFLRADDAANALQPEEADGPQ